MERHRTWRRAGRGAVLGVVAVALAVLAVGCGGSADAGTDGVATAGGAKGTDSAEAAAKKDPQQAGLDFAQCMRDHGVDVPDPQFSGGDGGGGFIRVGPPPGSSEGTATAGAPTEPPARFKEADEACRHFLDDVLQDGGGPIDAAAQDRMLEFTQCMRDHGVDMPDPDFSGGGGGFRAKIGGPGGVDPSSETFKEAQKACESLFGPDGPGGGPRFSIGSADGATSAKAGGGS